MSGKGRGNSAKKAATALHQAEAEATTQQPPKEQEHKKNKKEEEQAATHSENKGEDDEDVAMDDEGEGEEDDDDDDEEDDDDDEEEEGEYSHDLVGHLQDPPTEEEARLLTRWMFPSKVGGRPAWLVPRNLPTLPTQSSDGTTPSSSSKASLSCKTCSRPLRFLLQIYASQGSVNPNAFHRYLMLFICTSCQPNEARLFRSQLPWENHHYSSDRPDAKKIAAKLRKSKNADPELDPVLCNFCGLPHGHPPATPSVECDDCQRRRRNKDQPLLFQERELDTEEAECPEEDEEGGADVTTSTAPPAGDDEIEEVYTDGVKTAAQGGRDLVAEADGVIEAAKLKGASEAVLEKLQEYRSKVAENVDNAIDATEQAVFDEYSKEQGEHDPVFSKYNRYASVNAGHVLRYTSGGQPLWFCGPGKLETPIPPCELCHKPRRFEFQVQSMLISALRNTTELAERLDFGSIFCWTCEGTCDPPADQPYVEEFVFVQAEPREAWLPKS